MVPSLRDITYEERLERLDLAALESKRESDLITVYMALKEIQQLRGMTCL